MSVKFDIERVKATMNKIQEESNKIQTYLNECNAIIEENVSSSNGWIGNSASDFKAKWEKSESGFKNFVNLIQNNVKTLEQNIADQSKMDATDFV